jgi:pseudaminic acid cytidylyltransferase
MLVRAIKTAQSWGGFDHVVVSTDDAAIAALARQSGAEVPFLRPESLANDIAGTVPVIAHTTRHFADALGIVPSHVCCIYPCTPFLKPSDLEAGYSLLVESGEDFVYPVVEYPHTTFRAMRREPSGKMRFVFPEYEATRTQDLEATYHDAGQFYWGRGEAWLEQRRMHTSGIGMVVPSWRFVDIDTEDDWRRAEVAFQVLEAGKP